MSSSLVEVCRHCTRGEKILIQIVVCDCTSEAPQSCIYSRLRRGGNVPVSRPILNGWTETWGELGLSRPNFISLSGSKCVLQTFKWTNKKKKNPLWLSETEATNALERFPRKTTCDHLIQFCILLQFAVHMNRAFFFLSQSQLTDTSSTFQWFRHFFWHKSLTKQQQQPFGIL